MILEADRRGCARRGDRHRRRAVDPGPARAPAEQAGAGRPAARPLRRRALRLPRVPQPVALHPRAAARAVRQPVPQALQRGVPALPARPRVAGPRRPAAPGREAASGVDAQREPARAAPRSTSRCSPACSRTSACSDPAQRASTAARVARASRSSPARRWRGSSRRWVMAAELVETSRLWGRDAARDRARAGSSRWRRTSSSAPTTSRAGTRKRGAVVATERVTLYGLPIVAGRTVAYGAHRPGALARAVHPPRAGRGRLGARATRSSPPTRALLEEVEALEHRARRRDILADDRRCYDFYDARVPAEVVSGAHFDRWWRDARRADPSCSTFTRELLVDADAPARSTRAPGRTWKQGDARAAAELPLRARARRTTASPCTSRCAALAAAARRRLRLARARAAAGARRPR